MSSFRLEFAQSRRARSRLLSGRRVLWFSAIHGRRTVEVCFADSGFHRAVLFAVALDRSSRPWPPRPARFILHGSLHPELQLRSLDVPLRVEVPVQPVVRLRLQMGVDACAMVHQAVDVPLGNRSNSPTVLNHGRKTAHACSMLRLVNHKVARILWLPGQFRNLPGS